MAPDDLPRQAALERSERVFNLYRKSFSGFSDQETAILDGIMLEPPHRR
jgi:hypothetical protein